MPTTHPAEAPPGAPGPARAELRACAAVALTAAAFYAPGLLGGSHYNSDDALYAQMAREMWQGGGLVDNRWLGVVHFEKPPLVLWSLALAGGVLGWSEWALRLPVTLWAIAGLVALYVLARRLSLDPRAAATATALLASSTFYLLMTRRPMTDIPLLACALCAAAAWLRGRPLAAGAFAGLALLAKGPAAAPLLLPVVLFAALERALPPRAALRAGLCALAVAAPWYVASGLRHGAEFWAAHLGHHLGERMSAGVVPGLSWVERAELLGREGLLLPLAGVGLVAVLARRWARPSDRFACLWLASSALPLVAGRTVLPHYLLPLAPALALLAVGWVPAPLFADRRAPWLAGAAVLAALFAEPTKLLWWLDPDFAPDDKALGARLAREARPADTVFAYEHMNAALVFYSGGLPISTYSEDARFVQVQARVLMNRRQAGHPGEVVDLRERALPDPGDGRRFAVASVERAAAVGALLRAQRPERRLSMLREGALALINDANVGESLPD